MYRVLIADGDGISRDLLVQALSLEDCEVEAVSLGEEVLRRMAVEGVDVLITEVHLPDMQAWDLLPILHRLNRHVPVITVTADDTWETSRKVRVEGGAVFFYGVKPLNLREIQEAVRCAARWSQRGARLGGVRRSRRKPVWETRTKDPTGVWRDVERSEKEGGMPPP